MKAAVFFTYLCLLLLGGSSYTRAGAHGSNKGYIRLQHLLQNEKASHDLSGQLIKKFDSDNGKEYFINDDIEEEDGCNLFVKKQVLPLSCHSAFYSLFVSKHTFSRHRISLVFFTPASRKYILQRVLRI